MNLVLPAFLHIVHISALASLLIMLLLMVKRLLPNLLSARSLSLLWLLIVVRLLFPVQIELPDGLTEKITGNIPLVSSYGDLKPVYEDFSSGYQSLTQTRDSLPDQEARAGDRSKTAVNLRDLIGLLPYLWMGGFAALILAMLVIEIRAKQRLQELSKAVDGAVLAIADQCQLMLKINQPIPVYISSHIKSPCLAGIIKPAVYLPENCRSMSPEQLQHIILHEMAHYRRGDLIYNLLSLTSAYAHWFNPLVWLAVREMRYDREVACDTLVMEVLGEKNAYAYGMTIIDLYRRFKQKPGTGILANFSESSGQMERRINMINRFRSGSYKIPLIIFIVCVAVGGVLFGERATNPQPSISSTSDVLNDERLKDRLVLLDPGHGGDDRGATYPAAIDDAHPALVKEKEVNLDIALRLYELLQKSGVHVEMTRQEDSNPSLDERLMIAENLKPDLFLSIQCGQYYDEKVNGTRTYFCSQPNQLSSSFSNKRFAELLHSEVLKRLNTSDQEIKDGRFRLLKESSLPTVAVEIAYISNAEDRNKLMDEQYRQLAAQALHDGIILTLNEMVAAEPQA